MSKLKVGDLVYPAYQPAKLGVVTKVTPGPYLATIEVKWGTGKFKGTVTTDGHEGWIFKYETLVTETERKAKNHRKKLNDINKEIKAGTFP